jgi:tryptophan halogenase
MVSDHRDNLVRSVAIIGGGTAGWMAATALATHLPAESCTIRLVESEAIGTVGVGEATIPPIQRFHRALDIDEGEFLRATRGSIKLGIKFVDWLRLGTAYIHPFGGSNIDGGEYAPRGFHHLLHVDQPFDGYNVQIAAAHAGRFARRVGTQGNALAYAYHFDAGLYARFLRGIAEQRGVERIEGKVVGVERHPETGFIAAVVMADGSRVAADLFIDCTGFGGLLIEQTLGAGYDDWSHWLPADRAWAVPSARHEVPELFTRSTAREAGWQWRIPLQHRTGNGYVFSSAYIGEQDAADALMARLDAPAEAAPRLLKFVTGRRRKSWVGNCIAMGLSSGFLEPLESTSIYFVQAAIQSLLDYFPDRGCDRRLVDRFNDDMAILVEDSRDFLIAHYCTTEREDSEFWRYCKNMALPDSLVDRLDLFRTRGETLPPRGAMFGDLSWYSILSAQGLLPGGAHPVASAQTGAHRQRLLGHARSTVALQVQAMPDYGDYLARFETADEAATA